MSSKSTSVTSRILTYLKTGADITQVQARKRFGITNVRARMSELRQAGYSIYLNEPGGNTLEIEYYPDEASVVGAVRGLMGF